MEPKHSTSTRGKQALSRRKKLWEGYTGYSCSIIGTCLRREDIRKLARKKLYGLSVTMDDFEIHTTLVHQACQRCPQSRAMNKILDFKYCRSIKRYSKAMDDDTLKNLWDMDVRSGAIAGAYWAAMTHPTISRELLAKIYGQVHMLSHDFFVFDKKDKQAIEALRKKVSALEEVLVSERQLYLKGKKQHDSNLDHLAKLQNEKNDLTIENNQLRTQLTDMQSGKAKLALEKRVEELRQEAMDARQLYAGLQGKVDTLAQGLEQTKKQLDAARQNTSLLEEEYSNIANENEELHKEVEALETAMLFNTTTLSVDCDHCNDKNSDRCPGPDLCGKTILYVGGLNNMVPRYRQLVEKCGGHFIHHDGGKEAARTQLPKMLHTADAVLCPVDFVSHDATNCVKRICKRNQKPYVMMRSAGLSSLAKGLNEIIQ